MSSVQITLQMHILNSNFKDSKHVSIQPIHLEKKDAIFSLWQSYNEWNKQVTLHLSDEMYLWSER